MLHEKVILITGSTQGIGKEIARAVVAQGAKVMVTGLNEFEEASELSQELGDSSHYIIGNLADPSFCRKLVEETVSHFGTLDGIVNNAADLTRDTIEGFDSEVFDRIIAVNLRAPLLLITAALPIFQEKGEGVVVNIGSVNAECGDRGLLSYAISKGGLATATKTIANAVARYGVRINQLNIGWVVTPNEIKRKIFEGFSADWEASVPEWHVPFGRMTQPEDIASHVIFWLSKQSFPCNGAVCTVDQLASFGRGAKPPQAW